MVREAHAIEILTKEIIQGKVQEETTEMIYQKSKKKMTMFKD